MTTATTTGLTLEFDDNKLRVILQAVLWDEIIASCEEGWQADALPGALAYMMEFGSSGSLVEQARRIGAWTDALETVMDLSATSVTLPMERYELGAAVKSFIQGAHTNLPEVSLDLAHEALEVALYARTFLEETLGGVTEPPEEAA